jgi:hypothetical protein
MSHPKNINQEESRKRFIDIFYEFILQTKLHVIDFISAQEDKDKLIRDIDEHHDYRIIKFAVQTFYNKEATPAKIEMLHGLLKLGFRVHGPNCDAIDMPLRYCVRFSMFHHILSNNLVEKSFEIATLLLKNGHEMIYDDAYYKSPLYVLHLFAEGCNNMFFHLTLNNSAQKYMCDHEKVIKKLSKRVIIFLLNHGYDINKVKYDDLWYAAFLDKCCTNELFLYCLNFKKVHFAFL